MLGLYLRSRFFVYLAGRKKELYIQLPSVCVLAHVLCIFPGLLGCTWSVWCCWRDYCKLCPSYEVLEVSGPSRTCRYPAVHLGLSHHRWISLSMLTLLPPSLWETLFGIRAQEGSWWLNSWTNASNHLPIRFLAMQVQNKAKRNSTCLFMPPLFMFSLISNWKHT